MDNLIGFNMVSYRSCKNLWKSCVEHHTFFRLHAPKPAPKKGFFPWRPTFRYRSVGPRGWSDVTQIFVKGFRASTWTQELLSLENLLIQVSHLQGQGSNNGVPTFRARLVGWLRGRPGPKKGYLPF